MYAIADIFHPITPVPLLATHLTHSSFLGVSFRRIVSVSNISHLPCLPASGAGKCVVGEEYGVLEELFD
jgi:hypothetical protein